MQKEEIITKIVVAILCIAVGVFAMFYPTSLPDNIQRTGASFILVVGAIFLLISILFYINMKRSDVADS